MRDSSVRLASRLHTGLYRLSRGRLGSRLVDNDMLLLTTVGRSSGGDHTVPLLYLESGSDLVLIASYGGRPNHPDWYLNLLAQPRAVVQIGGSSFAAISRTTSGEERAKLWPRVTEAYVGYAEYQERTTRQIPVVVLSRI